ncbi:WecB/TagA/CpsF family glycosyltransferase [Ideonella sp.]|uniref:WecB/TagA/CpsF family glycosyltransferase n=1 Tax=Ideonella sp. TaxID=1929293 RepID=UPI002B46A644|nr:WecB/TagA/CpsF family glycosyltransferase [Ideonella sp.]HJV70876.1 WecB/TagA/CpsF family glycosyltransferase [Ideonella sp.]
MPLLNVWADDLTMPQLLDRLDADGGMVFTINPDHLYHLQTSAPFAAAYRTADFITVDSHYVWWALRWQGHGVAEKITGSDLFPAYCRRHAADPAVRIFLLGARPGVAQRARERINAMAGRELVVGAHGPSMDFVDDPDEIASVLGMVRASGATALMVGLGAPKQEVWLARHRAALPGVRVLMGIGATIDYEAGEVKRAPVWMRRLGLEWAYRVLSEPRRYGLRYLRNARFLWWMAQARAGQYRDPFPQAGPAPRPIIGDSP